MVMTVVMRSAGAISRAIPGRALVLMRMFAGGTVLMHGTVAVAVAVLVMVVARAAGLTHGTQHARQNPLQHVDNYRKNAGAVHVQQQHRAPASQ